MNSIKKYSIYLLIFGFLNFPLLTANAGIFKCVSENGKTYFIDKPCPVDNQETEFQAISDPVGGYIPPKFIPEAEAANKLGVIIGKTSSDVSQSEEEIDENAKASLKQNKNNQSGGQSAGTEGAPDSDLGLTSERSATDNEFNLKLKNAASKATKNNSGKERSNITILETSGV